uniref:Signal recognition particle subunit srp72 n=1 Tax=Solanum tuberosum TaxID=4113 RepID=M1C8D1_SOLTU
MGWVIDFLHCKIWVDTHIQPINLGDNLVAGLVSAGRSSEVQGTLDSLRVEATSSFELAYSTACSLIEREKYKDAEQLLLSARRQV